MQISVSSVLTVFHDGQFLVGLAERVEDGRYGVARIVFGAEPPDEEILQFVRSKGRSSRFSMMKRESVRARSQRRADEAEARFEQRRLRRKQKHREH